MCACVHAFNNVCDLNPLGVANQCRLDGYWQAVIKDSLSMRSVPQSRDCKEERCHSCVCIMFV